MAHADRLADTGAEPTRGRDGGAGRGRDFVQSLERGLAVIQAFPPGGEGLTPTDVAAATGLTRAAARRFLLTLVDLGYVRVDGRVFRLSPRVLELGRSWLSGLTLPELALPHLRELVAAVGEASTLAVLDGDEIVYVGHVPSERLLSVLVTVGGRDPAWATSLGRVLLAAQSDVWLDEFFARVVLRPFTEWTVVDVGVLREELARVREQGWAFVDQEFEEGLRALAAPVRDGSGRVIAAVNVNLPLQGAGWSVEAVGDSLLPRLLKTTTAIGEDIAAADARGFLWAATG